MPVKRTFRKWKGPIRKGLKKSKRKPEDKRKGGVFDRKKEIGWLKWTPPWEKETKDAKEHGC